MLISIMCVISYRFLKTSSKGFRLKLSKQFMFIVITAVAANAVATVAPATWAASNSGSVVYRVIGFQILNAGGMSKSLPTLKSV